MINYNWNVRRSLELGIGLSCCPSPAEKQLGKIWDRHRPALIGLLNSLQGIHIRVGSLGSDNSFLLDIPEANFTQSIETSDFWYLLRDGRYTVTITIQGYAPVTKLVSRVIIILTVFVQFDY